MIDEHKKRSVISSDAPCNPWKPIALRVGKKLPVITPMVPPIIQITPAPHVVMTGDQSIPASRDADGKMIHERPIRMNIVPFMVR